MPPATTGAFYSQNLTAAGGTPPFTWTVVPGSEAPAGMSLSPAGVISGTPTTPGTSNFTVRATDSGSPAQTAEKALSIVEHPTHNHDGIADAYGAAWRSYSQTLTATGGTAPYTWSSGTLPTGLELSSGGAITGEPSELGFFNHCKRRRQLIPTTLDDRIATDPHQAIPGHHDDIGARRRSRLILFGTTSSDGRSTADVVTGLWQPAYGNESFRIRVAERNTDCHRYV